jgi:poly(hydroxyalkanoate) granule-associated protein
MIAREQPEQSQSEGGLIMSEEVEVHVRQIDEESGTPESLPAVDAMRRLLLASIGAVAMSYDEAEKFISRLIERGELAQKDGEKVLNEVMTRFRQRPQAEAEQKANELGSQFEQNMEQFFNRLNIPTKRDIDDLSARVAQLAARVEELNQSSSTPSGKSSGKSSS